MEHENRLLIASIFSKKSTIEILEEELKNSNATIERKWQILDERSINWSWTQWKNFKDSLYSEIGYSSYIILIIQQIRDTK